MEFVTLRVDGSVSSRGELVDDERPRSDKIYADRGGIGRTRAAKARSAKRGVKEVVGFVRESE
jgi:hypothetical protein